MTPKPARVLAASALLVVLSCCAGDEAPPTTTPPPQTKEEIERLLPPGVTMPDASGETKPGQTAPAATAADEADRAAIKIDVLRAGEGDAIAKGQTGRFHYTGMLLNGKVFDSSRFDPAGGSQSGRRYGEPVEFALQEGALIRGWTLGIPGMKVGERRRLTIPARLGYGESGNPPTIPGNSTLVFDIELVDIVR